MSQSLQIHQRLTASRAQAYEALFNSKPIAVFPYHCFAPPNPVCLIDVLVYPLTIEGAADPFVAAVTNGMSDYRMVDAARPHVPPRRELIQYFRACTESYARRPHDAAYLPHAEGFAIDVYDTLSWSDALEDAFQYSFFLRPIWTPHAEFSVQIDSDEASFLWHIPLTAEEWLYMKTHGVNALLDRMDTANLPWWFDANARPRFLHTET